MSLNNFKIPIVITSTAVALGCAGVYMFLRHRFRTKEATEAFNYMVIKVITTEESCNEAISELRRRCQHYNAIGFDCEWVTIHGIRQPVALIQLSTYDGYCGLFRMNFLKTMPESLKNLLEDEAIYKLGVGPSNDAKYLYNDYSVELKSTLDLRYIAEVCGRERGVAGLGAMAKTVLNVILDKSWRIRCSDWQADQLSERQIAYAAADAHVAVKMFVTMLNGRKLAGSVHDLCRVYLDMNYKSKACDKDKIYTVKTGKELRSGKRSEVPSKRYPNALRSKPLYHNCFLLAPDGELLCTCDTKKALWYVEKQLGDLVQEDPMTVQLRFEPAGRAAGDVGEYYKMVKENKCVVCGSKDSYIRKNIVPREYRKYFPEIMKDHSSHDVVLLCSGCHQRSNALDQRVRERLAARCAAPLAEHARVARSDDPDCKKIRSAGRALLYASQKHELPAPRRDQLEAVLLQHYPHHHEVTQELLQEAANVQYLIQNPDYESHGQKVVEHYLKVDGLLRLEELWREHFLNSMQPKYMPQLWSIKHNEERLDIKVKEGRLSPEKLRVVGPSKWL